MKILWFRRRPSCALDLLSSYWFNRPSYVHNTLTTTIFVICNFLSVTYTVMQLVKYTFLSLLTISPLATAVPAPVSPHASLHSSTHPQAFCRPWRCADPTPSSHLFCQNKGCEYCREVGSGPNQYFVCDGFPASMAASTLNGANRSTTDVWEIDN